MSSGSAFRWVLRRAVGIAAALVLAALGLAARPSGTALAIQPFVVRVAGNCQSVQVAAALVYTHNDLLANDYFKIVVLDAKTSEQRGVIAGSVAQAHSPTLFESASLPASSTDGTYIVEVWDTNATGDRIRRLDRVVYQCLTGASWRDSTVMDDDPEVPDPKCLAWIPVHAVNTVPEDGALLAVWTYGKAATDPHYFVAAFEVVKGQPFDVIIDAPCGVYLKLYFQPKSTKQLYFLESQYHPHDLYGTPDYASYGPSYHMAFPAIPPPK